MSKNINELFSLQGRVIVITGAAGLLGRKHAEAVAAYGASPVLLDLSQEAVNSIALAINKKFGVKAIGFSVDITNEDQVKANAKVIIKQYGCIDSLVNNAANNPKVEDSNHLNFSRLENFSLRTWNNDISVALTGSFLCSKHYGFEISKNPNGGSIVNISSDLGLIAPDQGLYAQEGISKSMQNCKPVSYSVVKTGIIGLTRYLATYWCEENVRCNAICPGGVENNQSKGFLDKINKKIPLGRMAKVDEYQGTLIWVLSDASSYLNGAIIPVDGGRSAW